MPKLYINEYLVVGRGKGGYRNKVRLTKNRPSLAQNEVAFKLKISIDDSLFDAPVIDLTLPSSLAIKPIIQVEKELTPDQISEAEYSVAMNGESIGNQPDTK